MTNHMKEVAKMLGVEIGEEFEIKGGDGAYYLTYDGLYHNGFKCEKTLNDLLVGVCTIKHKPWKPIINDTYYFVRSDGDVSSAQWISNVWDHSIYKLGNCYRTREEAEANRDKWIAFYASDEVLEV